MMFKKTALLFLFGITQLYTVLGQKFTDKPEAFVASLKAQMATLGKEEANAVAQSFDKKWNLLTDNQKDKLIKLTLAMQAKGYKASPQYLLFFDCLRFGIGAAHVGESQLSSFLEVNQKLLDVADGKTIATYWEKSRSFFYTQTLFTSGNYKLMVNDLDYTFVYEDLKKNSADSLQAQKIEEVLNDSWDDPVPITAKTPEVAKPMLLATLAPGPRIDFKKLNLVILTPSDSVVIANTAGQFGFKENILLAKGGQMDWKSADLDEPTVTLGDFVMDVRNPKLVSPNSTLNYNSKIKEPLVGAFEYQSKKRAAKARPVYPKFVSNRSDIIINGLGPGLTYKGGFSLVGQKVYSTSVKSKISTLTYTDNDTLRFRSQSNKFEFADSLVKASKASLSIYIGQDSVYHPAIRFELRQKDKVLYASKIEKGDFAGANYIDNYHKMEINADMMRWYLNVGKIDFYIVAGKRVVPALFESFDNYDPSLYPSLTGNYGFHPLQVLSGYFRATSTDFVYLAELATYAKKNIDVLKNAYLAMQDRGLVVLDDDEGLKLTPKGKHYMLAFQGKKDYDNFLIPSFYQSSTKDSTANATIHLNSRILTINGVKNFTFSDSLNTIIVPRDGQVRIMKNRAFKFNGKLVSRNFRFRGSDFEFDYERFMVKMNQIDSVTFVPQSKLKKGELVEVGGNLRYDKGEIYINRPNNKSGRIKAPEYPKLVINSGLIVPFNQEERAGGVYTADRVFFKIPKIEKDSINSKDLEFAGTFFGGGLVPNFEEKLVSMPDNSLGFVHKGNGQDKTLLYGGKSSFSYKELRMDNKGLNAKDAEFFHLRSSFKASELIIYPDSLVATGKSGMVTEGSLGTVYYPKVTIKDFELKWQPGLDSLLVQNKNKTNSFELYNEQTKLDGELMINKLGVFANGTVRRSDAEIVSKDIKFEQNNILAKRSIAKVGPGMPAARPVMMSYDINVGYNTKNNLVKFELPKTETLEDTNTIYLPYSSYKTTIAAADWDITKKTITMKGNVANTVFSSLLPEQEGLAFSGSGALYDLNTMALNITGVPYIDVVDSRLKPAGGKVLIKKDGNMDKLLGARLEVDSVSASHVFANANIKVISKNNYQGDAQYNFVNALGDTTKLKITSFDIVENKETGLGKVKGFYTTAKAAISEKDRFMITPKMQFRGEISMIAGDPSLSLDGGIKPFIKKRRDLNNWIPYKGKNTDGVRVEINDQLTTDLGGAVFAGWHYRSNGAGLYTTFLSTKEAIDDQDLYLATGALSEDAKAGRFDISKLDDDSQKYYYDDQKNVISLEGRFNLFAKTDYVKVAGTARIVPDSAKYQLNTLLALGFGLPPDIQSKIANTIVKLNLDTPGLEPAEADKERLMTKAEQLLGTKGGAAYRTRSEFDAQPLYTAATSMASTFLFSDVDWSWNNKSAAFYSIGKVGLASMGTVPIDAQMTGFIEIKKSSEDELGLYLEAGENWWIYLKYSDNKLGILSSDDELNNAITAKEKPEKEGIYTFGLVDPLEKKIFVDNFRANYKVPKKPVAKKKPVTTEKKPEKKEEVKEGF